MPKLVIAGMVHDLSGDLVTIGRAPDNNIVIYDPSVSAKHAQLERTGDAYRLKDLGSTNGTRINGIPATDAVLRVDDRIRFGAVEARFETEATGSQPLPQLQAINVKPAESSIAPADFTNASPFQRRTEKSDPGRTIVFLLTAAAFAAFAASMFVVLTMRPPAP